MNTKAISQTDVINFGKYKGTPLVDLDHNYVRWLLSLENLDSTLRKKLNQLDWVVAFKNRKELAIALSKPCFKRTRFSANQRIAYNNDKYNKHA